MNNTSTHHPSKRKFDPLALPVLIFWLEHLVGWARSIRRLYRLYKNLQKNTPRKSLLNSCRLKAIKNALILFSKSCNIHQERPGLDRNYWFPPPPPLLLSPLRPIKDSDMIKPRASKTVDQSLRSPKRWPVNRKRSPGYLRSAIPCIQSGCRRKYITLNAASCRRSPFVRHLGKLRNR